MRKRFSHFRNPVKHQEALAGWVAQIEETNGYQYEKRRINTSLGQTQVYALNADKKHAETLVLFPGFRTSSLIWDLDQNAAITFQDLRVFFVETNGQPNLSDGHSPAIKSLDYGTWGAEVLAALELDSAYIAGASFGGLVCMKLAVVAPEKIKAAFLLNPGCFRFVSLNFTTIYYNLLPLIKPSRTHIRSFLDKLVFHKPTHQLSQQAENLLVDYLQLVLTSYKDQTEKPYYMGSQLDKVSVDTYLLMGGNDVLVPPTKSIARAQQHLQSRLQDVQLFEGVNHGIECYRPCLAYVASKISNLQ
jgi:pimeloyl-ACP methyl ester carboxylesterase